jgi:hypothetical protein
MELHVLWTVAGRECVARFSIEVEARNFIALLRTRHGARDVQLIDEDGVAQALPQGIPQALR